MQVNTREAERLGFQTREANLGDRLILKAFNGQSSSFTGFADSRKPDTVVCMPSETKIRLIAVPKETQVRCEGRPNTEATFMRVKSGDAIKFQYGTIVLLTKLHPGLEVAVTEIPSPESHEPEPCGSMI